MEKRLSIQQMVAATGLSAHTLRYYERIGLFQTGRDHSSGYRYYTERDMNLLEFIKRLRTTGMPIRDVIRYTDLARQGETTIIERLELLQLHRRRVEDEQREIERHLAAITSKIEYYQDRYALHMDTTMPFLTSAEEDCNEQVVIQEEKNSETDYSRT